MIPPPNLVQAQRIGLLTEYDKGIHTFSNSDTWFSFAGRNCDECRYWDDDQAGRYCAFEAAAFLHCVSPDLARLFGWTESEKYPGSWDEPDQCACFRARGEDGDEGRGPPPDPDPLQLALIADPTEAAALLARPMVAVPDMAGVA